MLAVLSVLLIDFIAGSVLFSFIQPVTSSRYEEITSTPIDIVEILLEGDKWE